jgi:hypothetical protein
MPLCSICGDDADKVVKCSTCGERFCVECGEHEKKLCYYCDEEDDYTDDPLDFDDEDHSDDNEWN